MAKTAKPKPADTDAPIKDPGTDWPILEPQPDEDESAVLNTVAGLDEGVTEAPSNPGDDLTPDALLGGHRDGHWTERENERS